MYQKDFSSTAVDVVRLLEKEDTEQRDKIALITLFLRAAYKEGWQESLSAHFSEKL